MSKDNIGLVDTAILGAGLAGLSAAYHGGGIIYEREKEIGGTCRSLRTNGYIFDFGIHVLHTRNRYVLGLLSKYKNSGLKNKRRSAWIYSHQTLTKYPFQANTFGLPRNITEQCLAGFKEALNNPKQNYSNYEDWVYATFGRGIADNFYLPYTKKFWTIRAREMTTDWLDVRVPRPSLKQVIKGSESIQKEEFGPNAVFRYPQRGGIQKIAEALCRSDTKLMLGKEVINIEPDKKIVYFNDRTAVRYRNLISTLPLPELFKVIKTVPKPVMQAANGLRHNSVFCVNLGIRREKITSAHWIYFPEENYAAFRISFPGNFSYFTVPKKWSSIQAEISHSQSRPIRYRDIVEKVIQDLLKSKIIKSEDKVRLINTKDIKYAYVIYDHNRLGNLKIIDRFLKKHNIYSAGRYGQWDYLWMDEAILSGKRVVKEIEDKIK